MKVNWGSQKLSAYSQALPPAVCDTAAEPRRNGREGQCKELNKMNSGNQPYDDCLISTTLLPNLYNNVTTREKIHGNMFLLVSDEGA